MIFLFQKIESYLAFFLKKKRNVDAISAGKEKRFPGGISNNFNIVSEKICDISHILTKLDERWHWVIWNVLRLDTNYIRRYVLSS